MDIPEYFNEYTVECDGQYGGGDSLAHNCIHRAEYYPLRWDHDLKAMVEWAIKHHEDFHESNDST